MLRLYILALLKRYKTKKCLIGYCGFLLIVYSIVLILRSISMNSQVNLI